MSVQENATIVMLNSFRNGGFLRRTAELEQVNRYRRDLAIAASAELKITALSGGNQQKVILARWLMAKPAVLYLDEPTRGIDVGAKEQIYRIIDELAAAGKGIVFTSSELPELFRCCDRILVLHEGRQAAIYPAAQDYPGTNPASCALVSRLQRQTRPDSNLLRQLEQPKLLGSVKGIGHRRLPGYFLAVRRRTLARKKFTRNVLPGVAGRLSIASIGIRIAPYQTCAASSIRAATSKPEFQTQPFSWCGGSRSISRSIHSAWGEISNSL